MPANNNKETDVAVGTEDDLGADPGFVTLWS